MTNSEHNQKSSFHWDWTESQRFWEVGLTAIHSLRGLWVPVPCKALCWVIGTYKSWVVLIKQDFFLWGTRERRAPSFRSTRQSRGAFRAEGAGEVHNKWAPVYEVEFQEAPAKIKLPPGPPLSPEAVVPAIIALELSEGLNHQGSLTVHVLTGPAPKRCWFPGWQREHYLQSLITPSIPVLSVDISTAGIRKNFTRMPAPDRLRYLSIPFIAISRVPGPY